MAPVLSLPSSSHSGPVFLAPCFVAKPVRWDPHFFGNCGVMASIFSVDAQAFPGPSTSQAAASDVIPVRGFCGLGFHRGPYGGCVPNGVPYGYVAPVVVAPYAAPVVVAPQIACHTAITTVFPTAAACPLRDGSSAIVGPAQPQTVPLAWDDVGHRHESDLLSRQRHVCC
jgi:hypothetical protein